MNRINIFDVAECCGCSACVQKCPKHAITLKNDQEGFGYPVVDDDLCVDCGACLNVCHMQHVDFDPLNATTKASYCAYNKNDEILKDSSSGGIFWLLVQYILRKNGVVYGAVADGFSVFHRRGSSIEDCMAFRKSKYLQSNIQNTYTEARSDLQNGIYVLYTGTPCQIAGLFSFLGKTYNNLITCDVVCHGVPSKFAFDKWLYDLEKTKGATPVSMVWRDKINGWKPNYLTYKFSDGSVWSAPSQQNLFQKAFLDNLYLRPSCYSCRYARLPRIADISLADFWGYSGLLKEKNCNKGLSIVIVSTDKGLEFIEELKEGAVIEPVNLDLVKRCSRHVYLHPAYNKKRSAFFSYLRKHSFTESANKYLYPTLLEKIEIILKRIIRRFYFFK
jgi:coenzyme F420-reducing hydrogenase beta subunit